jgi:general stress protein 26
VQDNAPGHENLLRAVSDVLRTVEYATIATVSAQGRPWNTPVYFARQGNSLYWTSRSDAEHSTNLRRSSDAFIVIYDSSREDVTGGARSMRSQFAHPTISRSKCAERWFSSTASQHSGAAGSGNGCGVQPGDRPANGFRPRDGSAVHVAHPLVGSGLFMRTLHNLRNLDRGFRHEGVLLVGFDAQRAGYKGSALRTFNQQALARVEPMPGVGREEMHINVVAPRYFEAMNTPIVLGRDFTDRDDESAPPVAIVNETFVRTYLTSRDPLGERLSLGGVKGDLAIVGVVRDAVYQTLKEPPPPTVYGSYAQMPGVGAVILVVNTPRAVSDVAAAIRADLQPKLAGKPLRMRP